MSGCKQDRATGAYPVRQRRTPTVRLKRSLSDATCSPVSVALPRQVAVVGEQLFEVRLVTYSRRMHNTYGKLSHIAFKSTRGTYFSRGWGTISSFRQDIFFAGFRSPIGGLAT